MAVGAYLGQARRIRAMMTAIATVTTARDDLVRQPIGLGRVGGQQHGHANQEAARRDMLDEMVSSARAARRAEGVQTDWQTTVLSLNSLRKFLISYRFCYRSHGFHAHQSRPWGQRWPKGGHLTDIPRCPSALHAVVATNDFSASGPRCGLIGPLQWFW
jgi:hypothetical protein